jgi:hypothetical protein
MVAVVVAANPVASVTLYWLSESSTQRRVWSANSSPTVVRPRRLFSKYSEASSTSLMSWRIVPAALRSDAAAPE